MAGEPALQAFLTLRREELRLSIREAAQRAGIKPSTLQRVERGIQAPQPDTLAALAGPLQVDIGELYRLAGFAMPALRPYLRQTLDLPEAAMDDVLRYLNDQAQRYGGASAPEPGEDEEPDDY